MGAKISKIGSVNFVYFYTKKNNSMKLFAKINIEK